MNDSDDPTDDRAQRIATSIRERWENRENQDDRRGFLKKSTLAGGALVALAGGTGLSLADQHEDSPDDSGGMNQSGMQETFDDVAGTDVDVLQYALSLERLEEAFYEQAAEQFSEDDFMESDALSDFSEEMRTQAWEYLQAIGDHESQHVEVLTQAVSLLGGEPTPAGAGGSGNQTTTTRSSGNETESDDETNSDDGTTSSNGTTTSAAGGSGSQSYDFGVETVEDFIQVGATLENVGVAAYSGAAPYIESPDLLATALSIHSVEARHAAFLNHLNGESPFPHAFDPAMSQEEVLEAIEPFVEGGDGTGTTTGTETETGTETGTETETETETATGTTTQNGTTTSRNGTTTSGNGTTTSRNGTTTTTSGNETTTDSS